MTPKEFSLTLSSPNQFNPTTTVRYDLPMTTQMGLRVYDALGRHVLTLVEGVVEAGSHETVVNSEELATGVYFFRMEAGTFIRTCKMLLLKQLADKDSGRRSVL